MKNTRISVKKETLPGVQADLGRREHRRLVLNTPKIDPFDTTLLGKGVPNYVLDPEICVKYFPPLATPEQIAAMNKFYDEHPAFHKQTTEELTSSSIRETAWIQTFSGKKLNPLNPRAEDICIEDIAHSLSQQCRFTGHTSVHYSVAQHCVLVSYLCNPEHALYGLLHDGSEYACVDLPTPLKRLPELSGYREIEKKMQQAIYRKFGLLGEEPADVKRADMMMLSIEANSFMTPLHPEWKVSVVVPTLKIESLSTRAAEELFLDRFGQLYNAKSDI